MPNSCTACPITGVGAWAPDVGEERTKKAKEWLVSALKVLWILKIIPQMPNDHIVSALRSATGTEKAVGEAIIESGVDREDVFVTSKLPSHHHGRVSESIQESLDNLGFRWLDMYLMHWPNSVAYEGRYNPPSVGLVTKFPFTLEGGDPEPKNADGTLKVVDSPTIGQTWAEMEKLLRRSKCEAIGVSNFSIKTLEELLKTAKVKPAINQVEMHPYLAQNDLLAFCKKHNIAVAAYAPSGYDTIILAWHLTRNVVILPKSINEEHQKENYELPTLEDEDVKKIDALDRGERLCNKADDNGLVHGWSYEQLGW
ncbi:reductase AKOR2 [Mycena rebaudengoi]|nr:reductase AKOR2 [Mycena rebaudengoi]